MEDVVFNAMNDTWMQDYLQNKVVCSRMTWAEGVQSPDDERLRPRRG